MRISSFSFTIIAIVIVINVPSISSEEARIWTSRTGSTVNGYLISKDDASALIRRQDGSTLRVEIGQLSQADAEFVAKWKDPLDEGLLYHTDFNDKTANDLSGNGNHGTLSGTSSGSPRDGKDGFSRTFDGRDDSFRIPLDINPSVHPQLTICVWAKPARTLKMGKIISHDDGGYDRTLGVDSRGAEGGGDFQWVAFSGAGRVLGSEAINSRDWVFLAVVYDQVAGEVTLYVDDRKYSKRGSLRDGLRFTSVGCNPTSGEHFDGNLDDLRIYSRALSEFELRELRNR